MKKHILVFLLVGLLSAGCEAPTYEPPIETKGIQEAPALQVPAPQTPETPKPSPTPSPIPPPPAPTPTPKPQSSCDPNYSGCVPIASDVDCASGSGNGPAYVSGPVNVIGYDKYDLDRDGDGVGCE